MGSSQSNYKIPWPAFMDGVLGYFRIMLAELFQLTAGLIFVCIFQCIMLFYLTSIVDVLFVEQSTVGQASIFIRRILFLSL